MSDLSQLITFENAPGCPICEHEESVPMDTLETAGLRLHYVSCTDCGMVFMNPRPTKESMDAFYASDYWEENAGQDDAAIAMRKQARRAQSIASILRQPLAAIDRKAVGILEIGSSFGETLQAVARTLREAGAEPTLFGIEPSTYSVKQGAENYRNIERIGTHEEDLDGLPEDSQFDGIILSHVLEHLYQPIETLRRIRRRLAPGGVFFLEVPNLHAHRAYAIYHLTCFSQTSLLNAARLAGLGVDRCFVHGHGTSTKLFLTLLANPEGEAITPEAISRESPEKTRRARKSGLLRERLRPGAIKRFLLGLMRK